MSTYIQRQIVAAITEGSQQSVVDLAAAEAIRRRLPLSLLQAHPGPDHRGPHTSLTAVLRQVCPVAVTRHPGPTGPTARR